MSIHNAGIWSNQDNKKYYENFSYQKLEADILKSGLENNDDLELIYPFLKLSNSILEVGAGYGRVIDFLLKKNCKAKITAIERCPQYIDILQFKYSNSITLCGGDLSDFESSQQFDAILWLWCGVIDFSQSEQPLILKKLSKMLNKSGLLFLESIFYKNDSTIPQNCMIERDQGKVYRYICAEEEILNNANHAGLELHKALHYKEDESNLVQNRIMYVFSKTSK